MVPFDPSRTRQLKPYLFDHFCGDIKFPWILFTGGNHNLQKLEACFRLKEKWGTEVYDRKDARTTNFH
jgi:hypothetical protein